MVGIRAVALALSLLTLAPPALMAQMFGAPGGGMPGMPGTPPGGGGMGPGGGMMPGMGGALGGGGMASTAPAGPYIANPKSLDPLAPRLTPCPIAVTPYHIEEFLSPTLNDVWPMEPSSMLPLSIEQRMRQEKEAREEQHDLEKHEKDKREREQEIRQELELERAGLPQPNQTGQDSVGRVGPGGVIQPRTSRAQQQQQQGPNGEMQEYQRPQQPIHEGPRDFNIEEAFAKFSILQGIKSRLRQFGYDYFDAQASNFAPVVDVPVGPDYVVGPQDTLAVHVWNVPDHHYNRSYVLSVEQDGTLVIPQIGPVPLAGLTFSQVEKAIHARLSGMYKRFEVHVAMARLRTIKVFVVGEVGRPGAYEVSSLATASNAVYAACGPTRQGSLRQIRVIREGKTVADLDFYSFLVDGDRSYDRRLQNGDVVVIPPVGSVVAISGAVKRSAIYEIRPGSRLTEVMSLAGGLTPVADRKHCHIFRIEPGKGRIMMDVDLTTILNSKGTEKDRPPGSTSDVVLRDGDYVRVGALTTQVSNVVSLVGAVKNPGPYEFKPGMRVSDLLDQNQMSVDAYAEQAEIVRTDSANYQTKVIKFSPKALFEGNQAENHALSRLDQIVLTTQLRPPNLVYVEGEVKRPGYFTAENGERLSSVLKRAGGFTTNAFPAGIVLIRESVKRKQQAELDRFVSAERQRLVAQSAGAAAGTAAVPGATAMTGTGIAEQQVLALRLQQLETIASRVDLGRVVVRLESIEALEGTDDDVRLEPRDKITIPTPPQTVSVMGSVKSPTTVLYQSGLQFEDYLRKAGNATEDANMKEAYIMRANGTSDSAYLVVKEVQPGDTIVIPQKIETKTPAVALWSAAATILGSVMLGVAAISVIGR